MRLVFIFRVADQDRASRNPFVRAKMPLLAGTQLFVSGRALVVVWPSFAEGRLLVAHGSENHCGLEV